MNRNNGVMGSGAVRSTPPGWCHASGQPLDAGVQQKAGDVVPCHLCGKRVKLRELPQGFGFGDVLVGYAQHKPIAPTKKL